MAARWVQMLRRACPPCYSEAFLKGLAIPSMVVSRLSLVIRSLEQGLWGYPELKKLFSDQPERIESTNRSGVPVPRLTLNANAGNRFELHAGQAANSWHASEIMGNPEELTGIRPCTALERAGRADVRLAQS